MSVKKSKTDSKPSGARRRNTSKTEPLDKGQKEEVKSTIAGDDAGKAKSVSSLSSRASRKVAIENGATSDKRSSETVTKPENEDGAVKTLPTRRVWPD